MTTSKADALAGVRPRVSTYKMLCRKVEEMIDETRGGKLPIIIQLQKHDMRVLNIVMLKYMLHGWTCRQTSHHFKSYALQLT